VGEVREKDWMEEAISSKWIEGFQDFEEAYNTSK
jgi:hypothetical protein